MGARACGHTQPQKLAAGMLQDQKSIQQPKRDRRDDEQIHRRNAVGMIAQKGLPALGWRTPSPSHVLCNRGLPDIDAKLEQFAVAGACLNCRRDLTWAKFTTKSSDPEDNTGSGTGARLERAFSRQHRPNSDDSCGAPAGFLATAANNSGTDAHIKADCAPRVFRIAPATHLFQDVVHTLCSSVV
jgi:hypothetical protein